MKSGNDPFEILRAHDPIAGRPPAIPDEALLEELLDSDDRRPRLTAGRRRLLVAAAVIAALFAIAAAWYAATRPVGTLSVTCYADTNLGSDRFGTIAGQTPSPAACNVAWQSGILTNPAVPDGTVPDLVGCVDDFGGLAVFPTDDPEVCTDLGLAVHEPDRSESRLDAVAAARREIADFIDSANCHPLDDTESAVRDILDTNGLDAWTIRRQPDRDGEPCGSVSYDIPGQTVYIVPNTPRP